MQAKGMHSLPSRSGGNRQALAKEIQLSWMQETT